MTWRCDAQIHSTVAFGYFMLNSFWMFRGNCNQIEETCPAPPGTVKHGTGGQQGRQNPRGHSGALHRQPFQLTVRWQPLTSWYLEYQLKRTVVLGEKLHCNSRLSPLTVIMTGLVQINRLTLTLYLYSTFPKPDRLRMTLGERKAPQEVVLPK